MGNKADYVEELQRENAELKAKVSLAGHRVAELKQHIEKMKCCYNCSKWNEGQCKDIKDSFFYFTADFNCDKWELKNE